MKLEVKYLPKTEKDYEMVAMAFGISIEEAKKAEYKIEKITSKDIKKIEEANKLVYGELSKLKMIDKMLDEIDY